LYRDGTIVLSVANCLDDTIKISIRISGYKNDLDLKSILEKISKGLTDQVGGHPFAAGAVLPQDNLSEFIENAKKVLDKVSG
jgi:single-stranded DNA-specific DHH superfamily exonuclease